MTHVAGWIWYRLIALAPQPENGESVNVGVLLGESDRARSLVFVRELPRAAGICSAEERATYAEILSGASDLVRIGGTSPSDLSARLGPQLWLRPKRNLYIPLTQETEALLARRFLEAPNFFGSLEVV